MHLDQVVPKAVVLLTEAVEIQATMGEVIVVEELMVIEGVVRVEEAILVTLNEVGGMLEVPEVGQCRLCKIVVPYKAYSRLFLFSLGKCLTIFENGSRNSKCEQRAALISKGA